MTELEVWIFRGLGGIIILVLGDYLINFRPSLAEKYRQKADCERITNKCHSENRDDHKTIFDCIEREHKEIMSKLDDLTKQIIEIFKNIKSWRDS